MIVRSRKEGNNLFLSALLKQPWLDGFENRFEFQIDSADIGEAFDDVVVVHLSNSSGITNQDLTAVFTELLNDANRFKIAITGADAITQCYVEIEDWNTAGQDAWLHVRVLVPVVGVITFYFYYDRTAVDNVAYVGDIGSIPGQRVWTDNHYRLVQHLYSAGAFVDSTGRGNNGIVNSAPTLQAGQVDGCLDFDGNDDYVKFPHSDGNDLDFTPDVDEFTMEVWAKWTENAGYIIGKGNNIAANRQYLMVVLAAGRGSVNSGGVSVNMPGTDFDDNEWHHFVLRNYDDPDNPGTKLFQAYIDGVAVGAVGTSGVGTNAFDVLIGARRAADNTDHASLFKGQIDEVHVLARGQTPERIMTMFLSQSDNLITYIV